ncbi:MULTISPECIES: PP2C family protein-serine/threonine phosphatase [unclassified Nocardioides]|uniref:PP2C family protein-serine/threonine phosphatase n=1 Tax=unclassified Nocardioides TaxID=2615069 RepID=UPI003014EE62
MSGDAAGSAREAGATTDRAEVLRGLGDVVDQVRSAMGADTATLLALDDTRTHLEPLATAGLDRTLHRARRVPVGRGFAGRVAQTRQPVALSHVDSSTVVNPVLLAHGVQSLLGVPVLHGSELLGVLHVGFHQQHVGDDEEKARLSRHAAEVGRSLHDRFADEAHDTALALQRSLLPTTVVAPPGLSIAARYLPADGDLGGDWYDVFELPGDRLGLVMGDVAGHGLQAAIRMGRLRGALRAYALDHEDPAEVLARLDRMICHFEPDVLGTVVLGVSRPPFTEWSFSSAGHFPPLVGAADGRTVAAELPQSPLLGFRPDTVRRSTTVSVPPGGFLCLYTDGLVERRPTRALSAADAIARNTVDLLTALDQPADPELRCIRALSAVIGDGGVEDDVAILVAQLDGGPPG